MEDLPQSFDVVVVGTGVAESIVAAACSRIGKEVLHLDRNSFYGGAWASFSWSALQEWIAEVSEAGHDNRVADSDEGNSCMKVPVRPVFHHVSQQWFLPDDIDVEEGGDVAASTEQAEAGDPIAETGDMPSPANTEPNARASVPRDGDGNVADGTRAWSKRRIEEQGRRFNIELAPKVIYSSGGLVGLLIQSNVSRYLEFKCVTRILTKKDDEIVIVPCSRADVFATRGVSVVEKRMLMRIMNFVSESEKDEGKLREHEGQNFAEFLRGQSLTDNLVHFVVHSIAMVDMETATVEEGVHAMRRFLNSLGRFGNSPFLWPMFGSGEIPQAFCRLCAVFGGTYFLNRGIQSIEFGTGEGEDGERVKAVKSNGARIDCLNLVMDSSYLPEELAHDVTKRAVSRAVLLTDRSIKVSPAQEITLFRIPKKAGDGDAHPAVVMLELGAGSPAAPQGIYVVHLTCPMVKSPEEDLSPVIDELFRYNGDATEDRGSLESKPNILWQLLFAVDDYSVDEPSLDSKGAGIHVLPGPADYVDFEYHVTQAKRVFSKMFPDEEFLPRAPDPDEIIIGGDESDSVNVSEPTAAEPIEDIADVAGNEEVSGE